MSVEYPIVLTASDVGPTRYLLHLAKALSPHACWLESGVIKKLSPEFTNIVVVPSIDYIQNPRVIIVGTILGEGLDKELLFWAKQKNVRSIAIVEHWTWFLKRFELGEEVVFPDWIFVNDTLAKTMAVEEGIPANKIIVAGNPVLEFVVKQSQELFESKPWSYNRINLPSNKRVITFVSECLASSFKEGTSDYLGYNEYVVLESLVRCLDRNDHLLIKLHPSEDRRKYASYEGENVTIVECSDIYTLSRVSDIVIGMESMLLLEISMLRRDVVSYRPNARREYVGNLLHATVKIECEAELREFLKKSSCVDGGFQDHFVGSTVNIVNKIKELVVL